MASSVAGAGAAVSAALARTPSAQSIALAATPTRILRGASPAAVVRAQSAPSLVSNDSGAAVGAVGASSSTTETGDNSNRDSNNDGRPVRKLPVVLRHGDVMLLVVRPEEDARIAGELEDVQARSRVVVAETLPRAVYRRLSAEEVGWAPPEPCVREEYYMHHSGEILREDLDAYVGYDMDSEDEAWLDALNARLGPFLQKQQQKDDEEKKVADGASGSGSNSSNGNNSSNGGTTTTLSKDDFELIIDRLEKVAFRRDQNRHSTMRQLAIDEGTEGCAVCGDGMSEDANQMIYCDGCDLAVHQECYGVPYIPEGSWKCARCLASEPVRCCLCHEQSPAHAIKRCVGGEWVHVICALWVPEATLTFIQGPGEIEYLDTLDVATIPPARFAHTCALCGVPGGACVPCAHDGCPRHFHPICAWQHHLHMKCTVPEPSPQCADLLVAAARDRPRLISVPPAPCSMGTYRLWCPQHRPVLKGVPLPHKKGARKHPHKGTPPIAGGSSSPTPTPTPTSTPTPTTPQQQSPSCDVSTTTTTSEKEPKQQQPIKKEKQQEEEKQQSEASVYAGVKLSRVLVKMRNINPLFVEAVHEYWVQKRVRRGHIPLMKEFDPAILMLSHPTVRRHPKAANDRVGYRKLRRLRYDLERARNMLELVRQRERTKLLLVDNARERFEAALALARAQRLSSAAPLPACDEKALARMYSPTPGAHDSPITRTLSLPTLAPSPPLPPGAAPALSQLVFGSLAHSSDSSSDEDDEEEDNDEDENEEEDEEDGCECIKPSAVTTGILRPPEEAAPFLRLYAAVDREARRRRGDSDGEDEDTEGAESAAELPQPQRRIIEVDLALRTEPEEPLVPPPRGNSWVVGRSDYAAALPVCVKRLSAKQRALYEQQQQEEEGEEEMEGKGKRKRRGGRTTTVLFPINSGATVQTGELPPPQVVKPTNRAILLAIAERLHGPKPSALSPS